MDIKKLIQLFVAAFFIASCNYTPLVPIATSVPADPPVTRTPRPTATLAPPPTRLPQNTSTPTITPTPVPSGVFALLFYRPLVLDYDPTLWTDKTCYTCVNTVILLSSNYLQAQTLASCRIALQGPTEINSNPPREQLVLGTLNYEVVLWGEDPATGTTSNWYLETSASIQGYTYNNSGLPVIVVLAHTSEWESCKALAESVLATLRVP